MFQFLGEEGQTPSQLGSLERAKQWVQWLRVAFSKGPNRVGVSFSSLEDGNRSSFRNLVIYIIIIQNDRQSP
jgi:hypothetical protein